MGGIYGRGYILGVVVRQYIDFLILLIPTVLFCSSIPTFCFIIPANSPALITHA